MIKIILIFLVLLGSVWLGLHLQGDPGYVLVTIHHWTLESTLWVSIGIIVFAFIIFHLLFVALSWLSHFPTSLERWRSKRRALASQTKTRQGLIEFSEGHWKSAKNHLIKGLPDADTPLLNYLTAARAAQEMGDYTLRDDFLREAQQCVPEAKIAVELTQAQLQLANRQWEQALATLRHLKDLSPNHPYVLKLLVELYQEIKDWPQLIQLLPDLKRYHVVQGENFSQLQYRAYYQALFELIKSGQPATVETFYKSIPKHLLRDPGVITLYSGYLLEQHEYVQAEYYLRDGLRHEFNASFIELYGMLPTEVARYEFMESLLKKHPHSAALHLALGRLAEKKQLWGKAKTLFEESIQQAESSFAYAELGLLLEKLGDQAGAFTAFRKGLLLCINSHPSGQK